MGLVCCRESSGGVAWTSEQAASSRVQAGRKQPPSGSGQRGGGALAGSLMLLLGLLSGLQSISQENKRESTAGMVWGVGMLPGHRLRVPSQKPMTRVAQVSGSELFQPALLRGQWPSVCLLSPRLQRCPRAPAEGLRSQPARKAKVFWAWLQLTALL